MAREIKQLDDVSLAMLFACGELEGEAREAFRRRVSADPALARLVSEASDGQRLASEALASADRMDKPGVSELAAVRAAQRLIRGELAKPVSLPIGEPVKARTGHGWWAYPVAAAACLAVSVLAWWGQQPVSPVDQPGWTTAQGTLAQLPREGEVAVADGSMAKLLSASLAVFPEQPADDRLAIGEQLVADADSSWSEAYWAAEGL